MEAWTLYGYNETTDSISATAQVNPEDRNIYTISLSPNPAYNLDTLYLTWTHPIWAVNDKVTLQDAGGQTLASTGSGDFQLNKGSGQYYIDPNKQYTYGTWTAHIGGGGILSSDGATATIVVKNGGRPTSNGSTVPINQQPGGQQANDLVNMLTSSVFWALIITGGLMIFIAIKTRDGFPTGIIGAFSGGVFTFIGWLPAWIFFSVLIIGALFLAISIVEKQMRNVAG